MNIQTKSNGFEAHLYKIRDLKRRAQLFGRTFATNHNKLNTSILSYKFTRRVISHLISLEDIDLGLKLLIQSDVEDENHLRFNDDGEMLRSKVDLNIND